MIKKKSIIYPFDNKSIPYVKFKKLFINYEIAEVCSPPGWGIAGNKKFLNDLPVKISSDFKKSVENCEAVIFTLPRKLFLDIELIISKIKYAAKKGKKIVVMFDLYDREKLVRDVCEEYGVDLEYYKDMAINYNQLNKYIINLEEFTAPIIFVAGDKEDLNKFEIQLLLKDNFEEEGYKVSQIGSRSGCEILGFHSFPEFMFNLKNEEDKVYVFNKFIRHIEKTEKPDLIIIGIPGGAFPLRENSKENLGIKHFMVSKSITPDFVVHCMMNNINEDVINYSSKNKFGYDVDCYCVVNKEVELRDTGESFYVVNKSDVTKKVLKMNEKGFVAYDITNEFHRKKISDFAIDMLCKNGV
ncbi:MAG: TIGR04066 family peptide maturation system protein [Clostridiales bacterium]